MNLLKDAVTLLRKKTGSPVKEGAALAKVYRLNEMSIGGNPDTTSSKNLDNRALGAGDIEHDGDNTEIPRNDGATSASDDIDKAIEILQTVEKSLEQIRASEAAERGEQDEELHILALEQERDTVQGVIAMLEKVKTKVAPTGPTSPTSIAPVGEKWEQKVEIDPAKKEMFKNKNVSELKTQLEQLKKSGPHKKDSPEYTKTRELIFALRAKEGWDKKVKK